MNKKRKQLLEAAISLFAKEGASVPTARIAEVAGVSNGTLFNHFATKEVLFDEVYLYIKREMADKVLNNVDFSASTYELLLEVWISLAKWSKKNPLHRQTLDLLSKSPVLSKHAQTSGGNFWSPISDRITQGINSGDFCDVPGSLLRLMAGSYLDALITYAQEKRLTNNQTEKLISQGFKMYWRSIQAK